MNIDLPDTTTRDVAKVVSGLAETGATGMIGRVLTLVVVTNRVKGCEEAIEAACLASREHPARVIVVIRGDRMGTRRLDAEVRVGGDVGAAEVIVLHLSGPLSDHPAAIITPLLLPDTPVVAWWPRHAPRCLSEDKIGALAVRRITDSDALPVPHDALHRRRAGYTPGDTDLAWSRLTQWRGLLAATLDSPPFAPVTSATVAGPEDSAASELLAGWLASRLGIDVNLGVGRPTVILHRGDESGHQEIVLREREGRILITASGQPTTRVALYQNSVADCLAEELRYMGADGVFGEALEGLEHVLYTAASTR